jgi:signal peptidase I
VAEELNRTAGRSNERPDPLTSPKPTWSTELPSIESVVIDGRRRIVYAGPSMNPTLREPDLLWVEPYGNRPVRNGDVVCFKSPEQDNNIVHRVASVVRREADGGPKDEIRTQGDNNECPDTLVLATDKLVGRVVAAQRGPRRRPVPGGHAGRAIAWSVRLRKSMWRVVAGVVSEIYQGLVRIGPFDFLLPRGMRPKLVCFNGRNAALLKLLMDGRAIGHYDHRLRHWHIRRPFRLLVDAHTLPVPVSDVQTTVSRATGPESEVPSPESEAAEFEKSR